MNHLREKYFSPQGKSQFQRILRLGINLPRVKKYHTVFFRTTPSLNMFIFYVCRKYFYWPCETDHLSR